MRLERAVWKPASKRRMRARIGIAVGLVMCGFQFGRIWQAERSGSPPNVTVNSGTGRVISTDFACPSTTCVISNPSNEVVTIASINGRPMADGLVALAPNTMAEFGLVLDRWTIIVPRR